MSSLVGRLCACMRVALKLNVESTPGSELSLIKSNLTFQNIAPCIKISTAFKVNNLTSPARYKLSCAFNPFKGDYHDDGGERDWDRQLHYVHAPRLYSHAKDGDDLGVDGWQGFTQKSYSNMEDFSAFMHNKGGAILKPRCTVTSTNSHTNVCTCKPQSNFSWPT